MKGHVNSFNQFNESRKTDQKSDGLSWYYGIADCKGLESFIKSVDPDRPEMADAKAKAAELRKKADSEDRLKNLRLRDTGGEKTREMAAKAAIDAEKQKENVEMGMMAFRCAANIHRWPVIYKALIQDEVAETIEDLMSSRLYVEALELLKQGAKKTELYRSPGGVNPKEAWSAIPNPALSPM